MNDGIIILSQLGGNMRRHTIIPALMVAIMAIALPMMAQVAPFPPDNRPYSPTDYLPNNLNPSVHLDLAIDLKSDSVAWSREDYFSPAGWRLNNGSLALPGHWLEPTRGPHWGLMVYGIDNALTNKLTAWGGPFVGTQNFRVYCLTDLNRPGRRWGLGFRLFY
ncbi:MAG: hypothetical protein NTY61_01580 [Candidatus Parcubacteria bacterium]|nr:hypothetical protein [Candidatus Parcubacteria bacterium]